MKPTKVNWDEWEEIEVVGIDEIALKRGHRDYVVLVTTPLAPKGVEVLAVLAGSEALLQAAMASLMWTRSFND